MQRSTAKVVTSIAICATSFGLVVVTKDSEYAAFLGLIVAVWIFGWSFDLAFQPQ